MARRPRQYVPGFPMHVIHRGVNRQNIFADFADRMQYRKIMIDAASRNDCKVHCYVLMDNHVHLLISPSDKGSLAGMMQSVGVRYVRYFNTAYQRTGGLWEGRYWASVIDTDAYLQGCHRYIELNPVRAGRVQDPVDWIWSSCRFHALGEADYVVTPHAWYTELGTTAEQRQRRYQALLRTGSSDNELDAIRRGAWGLTPLKSA